MINILIYLRLNLIKIQFFFFRLKIKVGNACSSKITYVGKISTYFVIYTLTLVINYHKKVKSSSTKNILFSVI